MKLKSFLSSKGITLCILFIALLYFLFVLSIAGAAPSVLLFASGGYLLFLVLWLLFTFLWQKRRMNQLQKKLSQLQEPYLAGELFSSPSDPLEQEYFEIMRVISRSAIGAVEKANREKQEYSDYVETFVHEIKTPLTACSLILDTDADRQKLKRELMRADNLTESILYYARLQTIEKDLQFTAISVKKLLEEALFQEMNLLILAEISAEIQGDFTVTTDAKLFSFLIKQLLINCAKYCPGCHISMTAKNSTVTITDNGPGIPAHELPRVTERGFTGARFRTGTKSTGMGLFIVKELCRTLNISMEITSKEAKKDASGDETKSFTSFSFYFPK